MGHKRLVALVGVILLLPFVPSALISAQPEPDQAEVASALISWYSSARGIVDSWIAATTLSEGDQERVNALLNQADAKIEEANLSLSGGNYADACVSAVEALDMLREALLIVGGPAGAVNELQVAAKRRGRLLGLAEASLTEMSARGIDVAEALEDVQGTSELLEEAAQLSETDPAAAATAMEEAETAITGISDQVGQAAGQMAVERWEGLFENTIQSLTLSGMTPAWINALRQELEEAVSQGDEARAMQILEHLRTQAGKIKRGFAPAWPSTMGQTVISAIWVSMYGDYMSIYIKNLGPTAIVISGDAAKDWQVFVDGDMARVTGYGTSPGALFDVGEILVIAAAPRIGIWSTVASHVIVIYGPGMTATQFFFPGGQNGALPSSTTPTPSAAEIPEREEEEAGEEEVEAGVEAETEAEEVDEVKKVVEGALATAGMAVVEAEASVGKAQGKISEAEDDDDIDVSKAKRKLKQALQMLENASSKLDKAEGFREEGKYHQAKQMADQAAEFADRALQLADDAHELAVMALQQEQGQNT